MCNNLKCIKRPTYEELIDYIERDPYKIKYPNRSAKFLRNSFQLSFLDHYSTEELNKQQENALKQQIAKAGISKAAAENGTSFTEEAAASGASSAAGSEAFQTPQTGKSSSSIPAEMPSRKPPPDAPGTMAPLASVSNQKEEVAIPNTKRKNLLEKDDSTPSPPKFPYTPPFNPFAWGAEKIAQGVVGIANFDISTPPEAWYTDEYRSPQRAAYEDNIEIYHKAVEKKQKE